MNDDEKKAKDMIGKYVLVGVNRLDAKENIINTEQIHGMYFVYPKTMG
jgi:hypothetical protein